jgi:hypothetical protein
MNTAYVLHAIRFGCSSVSLFGFADPIIITSTMVAIPLVGMDTDPLYHHSTIVNDGRPNRVRECLDDDDDIDMEK